jgi:hypothetical protein
MTPDDVSAWRGDLAFVVKSITTGHAEPFHAISEKEFRQAAAVLDKEIPLLSPHVIVARMGMLVASIGDGHTRLPWPLDPPLAGFHALPVQFDFFSDGVFVVAGSRESSDAVGGRVVEISHRKVDDVVRAITPMVSRDNRYGIDRIARRLLAIPEILDAVHVAPLRGPVRLVVEKDGTPKTIFLSVFSASSLPQMETFHRINGTTPPLHRSQPERSYWSAPLDGGKTMYFEVNSISNDPHGPTLPAFCENLLNEVDRGVERVIVDLRHNGGGSRELMLPCVEAFAARPAINRSGHLFVIVGHETFSAALWTALDFANRTHATIVGEPTAGKPNFFGETRSAATPAHHVPFTWASRMNWRTDHADTRDALIPADIIRESFADYASGRDPVINEIFRGK